MHKLKPITALGADMPPRIDTIGAVTITENPNKALASVAARRGGQADALAQAMKKALGLDMPAPPGKSTQVAQHAAFWMGPEQWMVTAAHDGHELLATDLKAIVGPAASVTEQTDGWCCFDVTGGAGLADLFERLSPPAPPCARCHLVTRPAARLNTSVSFCGFRPRTGSRCWHRVPRPDRYITR